MGRKTDVEGTREARERGLALAGWARTGACALEGCDGSASLYGLCNRDLASLESGKLPKPPGRRDPRRCAIRGCTEPPAEGTPYGAACLARLRSIRSGKALKAAERSLRRYDFRPVGLDRIVVWIPPMHVDLTPEAVATLASSLADGGLRQPVLVIDLGNGRYGLVFGHRRVAAARRLGWTEISAFIAPPGTPREELLRAAADENLERDLVGPFERALWLAALVSEGMSQKEVAAAVRMGEENVSRHLSVLRKAAEPVLAAIRDGRLPLPVAYDLVTLQHEEQAAALRTVLAARDRKGQERAAARAVAASREAEFRPWLARIRRPGGADGVTLHEGEICWKIRGIRDLRRFYFRLART